MDKITTIFEKYIHCIVLALCAATAWCFMENAKDNGIVSLFAVGVFVFIAAAIISHQIASTK